MNDKRILILIRMFLKFTVRFSLHFIILKKIFVCVCTHTWWGNIMPWCTYRGQKTSCRFLFLFFSSCGLWELNSDSQAWLQVPLLAKPSLLFSLSLFLSPLPPSLLSSSLSFFGKMFWIGIEGGANFSWETLLPWIRSSYCCMKNDLLTDEFGLGHSVSL